MSALVHAVPATATMTGRPVTVVGGLAVVCRLSRPYRATSDLDVVGRCRPGERGQLELLVAGGAKASGASGALVPTPLGPVQVDVLEVKDAELDPLPDDPTDRLSVLAHAWAAMTAAPMLLRAQGLADVSVAVAGPGPLIAMKLQSIMNRGAAKEGTDLLDILRLTLDSVTGPTSRSELRGAAPQLRRDAVLHTNRWFFQQAARSLRLVRAIPEGRDVEPDDITLVGELLMSALGT